MTASDSIQKAQTCGQKCVCGNMWKLSKDVATLQLLLQLVATSGSAAIFVVFLIINCGVSGSMQSKRRSPLPIWPHRETNNYISLLKYYLPRWLTTGYFTVFPFARKCQPNRSTDEKGSVLNQIYLPRRVYSKFSLICATTCTNEVELSPLKSTDLVF